MILLLIVIMCNLQDSVAHSDLQSNENDSVKPSLYECITEHKCYKTDNRKKMDPNCQPDPNQSWLGKLFVGNVKYECLTGESGTTSKAEIEGSTQVVTVKPEVTLTQVLTTQRTTVTIEHKQTVPSTTVQTLGTTELKTEITTEAHLKTSTTTPPITSLIKNLTSQKTTGAANTVPITHSTIKFKDLTKILSQAPTTTPSVKIEEYITMKRHVVTFTDTVINVASTESSKNVIFEIRNTSSERNMFVKPWHEVTERNTSKLNPSEIITIKLNHSVIALDNVTEDGKHSPPRNKEYKFSSFNRIAVKSNIDAAENLRLNSAKMANYQESAKLGYMIIKNEKNTNSKQNMQLKPPYIKITISEANETTPNAADGRKTMKDKAYKFSDFNSVGRRSIMNTEQLSKINTKAADDED